MKPIKYSLRIPLVLSIVLLLFISPRIYAQCSALTEAAMEKANEWSGNPIVGQTYKVKSWFVQDGDSLSLANGHRLRLGQINTTEMANKGRPEQAYAQQAKTQLNEKLQQQKSIYLQLLPNIKDHYGRWLVKLYDGSGVSVDSFLVSQGLAYVISMNEQGAENCLWQREEVARRNGLGIWQAPISRVHAAALLKSNQGGFMRMAGEVNDVSDSQHYWYIGLGGQVAVRIPKCLLAAPGFNTDTPKQMQRWVGQTITVRGWLAWRKLTKKQLKRGFHAGVMSISHLHMLEQTPVLNSN